MENPSILMLPESINQTGGSFIPAVIDWHCLSYFRDGKSLYQIRALRLIKVLSNLRTLFLKPFEFFLSHWLIHSILQYCELILQWVFTLIRFRFGYLRGRRNLLAFVLLAVISWRRCTMPDEQFNYLMPACSFCHC